MIRNQPIAGASKATGSIYNMVWKNGMEKQCNECLKVLPASMFYKRVHRGKEGLQHRCKTCQNNGRQKYYKPNEKTRRQLKISDEFYEELMKTEECDICGKELEKKCIDHCHETKKIRGVLCNNCNTALGLFKDDPVRIENAIRYLEQATQLR